MSFFFSLVEIECTHIKRKHSCTTRTQLCIPFLHFHAKHKKIQHKQGMRIDSMSVWWFGLVWWHEKINCMNIKAFFCVIWVFFFLYKFSTFATHARTRSHYFKFDTHNQNGCCCFSTHLLLSRQSCQMFVAFFSSALDWLIVCLWRVNCKIQWFSIRGQRCVYLTLRLLNFYICRWKMRTWLVWAFLIDKYVGCPP